MDLEVHSACLLFVAHPSEYPCSIGIPDPHCMVHFRGPCPLNLPNFVPLEHCKTQGLQNLSNDYLVSLLVSVLVGVSQCAHAQILVKKRTFVIFIYCILFSVV